MHEADGSAERTYAVVDQSAGRAAAPQQGSSEWNGSDQPAPRRRRRKRKRRPQQQQQQHQEPSMPDEQQTNADDAPETLPPVRPTTYWRGQVSDDLEALHERDGIVVSINQHHPITPIPTHTPPMGKEDVLRESDNGNSKEIIQGIVLRVGEHDVSDANEEADRPATSPPSKSYRRPYSAKRDDPAERPNGSAGAAALKNLLKNSGGMSLSEILQQQNMSLDDLLKGKQNALQVLQSSTVDPSSDFVPVEVSSTTAKTPRRVSTTAATAAVSGPQRPNRRKPGEVDNDDNADEKSPVSRRIPSFPNKQHLPKTATTASTTTTSTAEPTILDAETVNIVGTMASFLLPSTKQTLLEHVHAVAVAPTHEPFRPQSPVVRRIPAATAASADRSKTIKEVVSAIRPDLHNSSTRKRLFPGKGQRPNATSLAVTTTTTPSTSSTTSTTSTAAPPRQRYEHNNKLPPRFSPGIRLRGAATTTPAAAEEITIMPTDHPDIDVESVQEIVPKVKTTVRTPDITKDIIKSLLALRPRLKPFTVPPSSRSTTESPALVYTTMLIMPEDTDGAADNDDDDDAIATTTLPSSPWDDTDAAAGVAHINVSHDNLHELIAQYEPEVNAIEQLPELAEAAAESGIGSMETIEEMFQHSFGGGDDDEQEAITSRSDSGASSDVDNDANSVLLSPRQPGSGDVTERNPSLFADITSARTVDDRTDLLELLEDRRSGARLVKVLTQRNMTLAQLIAHRQRGSSQLHLAEIFLNRTQQEAEAAASSSVHSVNLPPPPAAQASDVMDVVTAFQNFPAFNLDNVRSVQPDDVLTDSQGSSYFTSITNIKPTDEVMKEGRALRDKPIDAATAKPPANHKSTSADFYQPWNDQQNRVDVAAAVAASASSVVTHRTIVLTARMGGGPKLGKPASTAAQPTSPADEPIDVDSVYKGVEQIETNADRSQDIIDMELTGHGYRRQSAVATAATGTATKQPHPVGPYNRQQPLPMGVRSAIVASASIVGVSLFIFIAIFAACRWRQRRKKTFNYAENFQAVRSRLPILTARESARSSSGGEDSSKRSTSPPMVFHTLASAGGGGGMGGMSSAMSARGSKINTMDPNSPEVQEYLYDAMRNPYQ